MCIRDRSRIDKQIDIIKKKIELMKSEYLETIEELDIIYARKYLNNYNWRNISASELQSFLRSHLNEALLNEYTQRGQLLEDKANGNLEQQENCLLYTSIFWQSIWQLACYLLFDSQYN